MSTNRKEEMMNFYKVIYSERSIQPMAARILAEETSKMLHFKNADMSAVSFAMTIHGLMDYELDRSCGGCKEENPDENPDKKLLDDYLKWFCEENALK